MKMIPSASRMCGVAEEQSRIAVPKTAGRTGSEAWLQEIDAILARTESGIAREDRAMTSLLERLTVIHA